MRLGRGGKAQIEQVALNLILNATAAMHVCPPDERRLRLAVSRAGDGGVVVAVCDSGAGIPREHIESVFEPFWTTRREGLGLGLAVCRLIVQAHGGCDLGRAEPRPRRHVPLRAPRCAERGRHAGGRCAGGGGRTAGGDRVRGADRVRRRR